MAEMAKIKRSLFAAFINTGTSAAPNWARFGKGITSQNISYNPNTTTETYIDEDNATTSVESYAPSLDGTQTCYKGEPVFEYLDGIRKKRAVGAELNTDVLFVYLYDGDNTSGYAAEKNPAIIQFGEFGGDGGGNVTLTYTLGLNGDPEIGTVKITDGKPVFSKASK